MNLIEQIEADREAGTAGPWESPCEDEPPIVGTGLWVENIFLPFAGNEQDTIMTTADARRIARVPDMEAALLAADQLIDAALPYIHDHGSDLADAIAAYRKATQ